MMLAYAKLRDLLFALTYNISNKNYCILTFISDDALVHKAAIFSH
jgi:hypothetical protein